MQKHDSRHTKFNQFGKPQLQPLQSRGCASSNLQAMPNLQSLLADCVAASTDHNTLQAESEHSTAHDGTLRQPLTLTCKPSGSPCYPGACQAPAAAAAGHPCLLVLLCTLHLHCRLQACPPQLLLHRCTQHHQSLPLPLLLLPAADFPPLVLRRRHCCQQCCCVALCATGGCAAGCA